ncbi:MAG: nucleotide pyrophosphohydrolase [Leptolyngbya sp. SIO3F4]|nr:nucleotide pyrophosphohydrolase [Leptolyngbya sp. SIO3F4]
MSEVALRGVAPGDSVDDDNTMVLWNVIGLLGESSEFAGLILERGLHPLPLINQNEFSKELGDVSWYLAAISTKLGLKLSTIQEQNIDKLKKRFPEGFTIEDSVKRVDVTQIAPKTMANLMEQAQRDLGNRVSITEGGV